MSKKKLASLILLSGSIALFAGVLSATSETTDVTTDWTRGEYEGTREQVLELMGYYKSIQLSPDQERIRREALSTMPAPCCNNFSAATCCCECNLSRSIWGLSKLLITQHEADAQQVRKAVEAWIAALNPEGYEGQTCTTGRCNLPFKADGCGGMMEHQLIYDS